jgi:hypothetical protein
MPNLCALTAAGVDMNSLANYAAIFDGAYTDYADPRYGEILELVEIYATSNALSELEKDGFARAVELIRPIVAIKKLQVADSLSGNGTREGNTLHRRYQDHVC